MNANTRIQWLHKKMTMNSYPNAQRLAERFGISHRQAQRDFTYLKKELGDIAWYLAEAATALDITLESVLEANVEKLKKRYPEGFETKRSIERADVK